MIFAGVDWAEAHHDVYFQDEQGRRLAEDTHHQALRALGNRPAGILHGCLASNTPYSEDTTWAHRVSQETPRAA